MEEKQIFNTFDSFSVLTLTTGVLILIVTIISNATTDRKEDQAKVRAEQLAVQILVGGLGQLSDSTKNIGAERLPAANSKLDLQPEGRIGMDPWGNPYHYLITKGGLEKPVVYVYSYGPNRKRDTAEGLSPKGDDVGAIAGL